MSFTSAAAAQMPDLSDEQQVRLILLAMGKFLRVTPSRTQVKLYSRALADLGGEGMQRAFAQMMADPDLKPGVFPLTGQIRQLAQGSIDDEADRVAMRIMKARHKFSAADWAEAQAYVTEGCGPLGWEIVRSYGWPALCSMREGNSTTLMSQLRGIARAGVSLHRRAKATEAMLGPAGKNLAIEGLLDGSIAIDDKQEDES